MTRDDISTLEEQLHALYGDRFPRLRPAMAVLWYDALKGFDTACVMVALRRFATESPVSRVPTLHDLVERAIKATDHHDHEQKHAQALARGQGGSYTQALHEALEWTPYDATLWAQLHVEMFEKGVARPGRYAEA